MANLQKKSLWQQYGNLDSHPQRHPDRRPHRRGRPQLRHHHQAHRRHLPQPAVHDRGPPGVRVHRLRRGRHGQYEAPGQDSGGTIGTFIFTGAIAGVCVLVWVNLFSPSAGTTIELVASEVGEAQTAGELLVSSLTVSDFSDLWGQVQHAAPSSSSPSSSASASPPAAASRAPWASCWPT